MSFANPETVHVKMSTTLPTGSGTTTLIDTTTAFGLGVFRTLSFNRLQFAVENSHSGTLKLYRSTDHGTTWDQVGGDEAVAAAAATDISGPYDYPVDGHLDVKLEWVNGGTDQTTWRPEMSLIRGLRSKAE